MGADGHRIYSGVHVPSKAFAEVVKHEAGTPYITAEELMSLIGDKADITIYDTDLTKNIIPIVFRAPSVCRGRRSSIASRT